MAEEQLTFQVDEATAEEIQEFNEKRDNAPVTSGTKPNDILTGNADPVWGVTKGDTGGKSWLDIWGGKRLAMRQIQRKTQGRKTRHG